MLITLLIWTETGALMVADFLSLAPIVMEITELMTLIRLLYLLQLRILKTRLPIT